ncbi:hypothetical protein WA026_000039 [Henosepilachna vigintioctopunctata]|uniref:Uncharacterized protein n=1 Tax=Henosepilachna vigintioctopunctata TaxID=420089 RepID=A0AAW1V6M3_9CUCU
MGSVPKEVFIFSIFLLSTTYASESINTSDDMFTPNYTSLIWNVTYHSRNITHNDSGFLNGYYEFVLSVVDILVPEALPLGIRTLEDFDSIVSLIPNCIWSYRRFVLFLLVVVGQIIFLIYGIFKAIYFFLPSRKTHSYATKNTSWKRRIFEKYGKCLRLGWIHSYFTLLVFMIALAHSSNKDINLGTKTVTVVLGNSVMDTETYIDTSTEQLEILLTNNLEEYLEFFVDNAERTAEEIVIDLGNSVANINLLGSFSGIEESFKPIEPILKEIKSLAQVMIDLTDEIVQGVMVDGNALINGTFNELEKGIDFVGNITGDITGGVIGAIEDPDNFTSGIADKTIEEVDKLQNVTTNVVGDVIGDLGNSGKILNNITSSIGEDVIEGGNMLTNLTENIGESALTELDKTKDALTDLTAGITGENITVNIDAGVDKITNITENIGDDIISGIGTGIDEGGETLSNIGDGIDNVAGNVEKGVGGAIDSLLDFGNSEAKDVTKIPNGSKNGSIPSIPGKQDGENVVNGIAGEVGARNRMVKQKRSKKSDGGGVETGVTQKPNSGKDVVVTNVVRRQGVANYGKDVVTNVVGGVASEVGGAVDGLLGLGGKKSDGETGVTQKPNSGKDVVTNVVGGVASEVGGAVDGLLGLGGKKSDGETGVTQKPNSGKDVVTNVVGGVASEVGGAVDGLLGLGGKKSDGETGVTQKPNSERDEKSNVVGGIAGEVGGAVNNIFESGLDETNSVTNAPTNSEREKTGVLGGKENGVEGAVNSVFGFGNNEKYTTNPPSGIGPGGDFNNRIDLRSGGTEDELHPDDAKPNKVSKPKKENGNGLVDNVIDEVGSTSKKIMDLGDNLFGLRRKRELSLNFDGVIDGFRKIYSTIDHLEHFMNEDLLKMNNISVLLTPLVKEIGVTVRSVLDEVKEDVKLGAKPLEKILDVAKKEVGEVKHELLSLLRVIFDEVQMFINVIEPTRYFISYFVTYLLLLAFILLIIGMTTRIARENCATEYMMKGGCTALYAAALIMACISLVYIGAGVASQKLVCETFQGPNDNGVLDLIDEMNPINLGSHFTLSVKKIIHNCHKDKSIYEVADLQKIFDLEEFKKNFNIEDTEKKLQEALDFPLNFTKILPFEEFEKAEEILFGTFKEIMDSPVITAIDSLEDKLGSLPGIGDILKTFTGNLMSFQKNFNALKSAKSKDGNKSFFDELENAVINVEKELTRLENSIMEGIQKISSKLQHRIVKSLTMYVEDRLIYSIQHTLGRCKPLSLALNSSVNAVCKDITTPANGHWFSWFICVTISIIILIYSSSYRNISRKNSSRKQSNVFHVEEEEEMHTIAIANQAK